MKVLGLMSGTSMDGLDCCLADILIDRKYNLNYKIIKFKTYKYPKVIKDLIYKNIGNKNKDEILKADIHLGKYFYKLSRKFVGNEPIDLISSHGQTIHHLSGFKSKQIGHPKYLYEYFKVPLIYNFRKKDIQLGGQGAPLIPFLDWLIFKNENKNLIILNIGGIANISYIPKNGLRNKVFGFDTGPGMCLIDELSKIKFKKDFDIDAKFSSKGKINHELLEYLMQDKYICMLPPKSTTREYFGKEYVNEILRKYSHLSNYDILRTFVKFTSESIISNINLICDIKNIDSLIVSGGGSHHRILINDMKEKISNLSSSNDYNISVDSKEALLMCVMGYTSYFKIHNNMPTVTGACQYDIYGEVYE